MKLYECDDYSECSLKQQCMNFKSKTKTIYSQRKIDVEPDFGFMKAILGFTRMSVRGINKAKRELGFVLMALNIRKVTAQRTENIQKIIKKTISIGTDPLKRELNKNTMF